MPVSIKQAILHFLNSENITYDDLGVAEPTSVDYPDFAAAVAEAVSVARPIGDLGLRYGPR